MVESWTEIDAIKGKVMRGCAEENDRLREALTVCRARLVHLHFHTDHQSATEILAADSALNPAP